MRPFFLFAAMVVTGSVTTALVACSGTTTSTGDLDGGSSGTSGTSGTSGRGGGSSSGGGGTSTSSS